jgi:hypothetical protein
MILRQCHCALCLLQLLLMGLSTLRALCQLSFMPPLQLVHRLSVRFSQLSSLRLQADAELAVCISGAPCQLAGRLMILAGHAGVQDTRMLSLGNVVARVRHNIIVCELP